MSDWTKSYSSLELLETLRKDLEMLDDVHGIDPENTTASISVVDALIERLKHLETEIYQ